MYERIKFCYGNMVFEYLKLNKHITDKEFDTIYPEEIKKLGRIHWTPVEVAKQAAEFLAELPGARILDIGSGAGKFCLIGCVHTDASFTGVEQRENLYKISNRMVKFYNLPNIKFIHSNITDIEFRDYNAFYYYNPFYENIEKSYVIDDSVELKTQNYNLYTKYVKEQLDAMPKGTRLATYWSSHGDVPRAYSSQYRSDNGLLEMWVKTR